MNIFNWVKTKNVQEDAENYLVDEIIKSMANDPSSWDIGEHRAVRGTLSIWIANSPYADMTIHGRRLPRRGELRKALALCAMKQKTL